MSLVETILLWLHFLSLALGAAAGFGIPVIGVAMDSAPPEGREVLAGRIRALQRMGHAGIGLLVLTGLALVWTDGGIAGDVRMFWIKMVLVALLFASIIGASRTARKALAGDAAAAERLPTFSKANVALMVLIVLFAVLAFG